MNISIDLLAALPVLVLVLGAAGIFLIDLFDRKPTVSLIGVMTCVMAWVSSWSGFYLTDATLSHTLRIDVFSSVFVTLILLGTALVFMLQDGYLEGQRLKNPVDVGILMLLAAAGAVTMVSAVNLIVLFLGLELMSVLAYVLTGSARTEKSSAEGALKYFILGAFSSAFLLYGIVLVYAATGSLQLEEIGRASALPLLFNIGLGLMIFGFGFKVSLVPFHFWTPDAYQGAPTSLATFMAVVVKVAAFGAFLRVMSMGFDALAGVWPGFVYGLAVVTMTLGNLAALRQRSLKRLLAYSSIAHAGYVLIGFLVLGTKGGGEAVVFYMLAYALMTLSAFGVVLVTTAGTDKQYAEDDIESLRGLGWSKPFVGLVMVIAMLSLGGLPPLAGFVGKFHLFRAAISGGFVGLAVIGALNSVISLYYYLRVVVIMYFGAEKSEEVSVPVLHSGARIALGIAALGTLYIGLFSEQFYQLVQRAMQSIG